MKRLEAREPIFLLSVLDFQKTRSGLVRPAEASNKEGEILRHLDFNLWGYFGQFAVRETKRQRT